MDSKQLFIEHLAGELQAMEVGRVPMNALRYRVHAKMLRKALQGATTPSLLERQGGAHPQVVHALSNRFFEETGHLLQPNATAHKARSVLDRTLANLKSTLDDSGAVLTRGSLPATYAPMPNRDRP